MVCYERSTIREMRSCFVITPVTIPASITSTAWWFWRIRTTVPMSIPRGTVGKPGSMKSFTTSSWPRWALCSSITLTMAASEIHPTGTPSSMTGSWEMLLWFMISIARATGSDAWMEKTGVCMTSAAVIRVCSAVFNTCTIFLSVLVRGSTLPASIRATIDWLIPARAASSVWRIPSASRRALSSSGVGMCIPVLP